MKKFDYIVVGQGIAGTLLTWFLQKRQKKVLVVDDYRSSTSSRVAGGLFNPITGKRFVKTWLADDIFPFAEKTYKKLEEYLDCDFYYPKTIIRKLSDELEKNEWKQKKDLPEYKNYLGEESQDDLVTIRHGGYVDFNVLLAAYRDKLRAENIINETGFDYKDLTLGRDSFTWKDFTAEKIIFCEGYRVLDNPFFKTLPFTYAKGEILTIKTSLLVGEDTNKEETGKKRLPHVSVHTKIKDEIISSGIFLIPIGENLFRVGSTYNWEDKSETPTEAGKQELTEKLEKLIGNDYKVIDHKAGIRPTVKDRRPILGLHNEFHFIGLFNGLGTKGASLGPYLANHFCEFLEDGKPLMEEVSLGRFE